MGYFVRLLMLRAEQAQSATEIMRSHVKRLACAVRYQQEPVAIQGPSLVVEDCGGKMLDGLSLSVLSVLSVLSSLSL